MSRRRYEAEELSERQCHSAVSSRTWSLRKAGLPLPQFSAVHVCLLLASIIKQLRAGSQKHNHGTQVNGRQGRLEQLKQQTADSRRFQCVPLLTDDQAQMKAAELDTMYREELLHRGANKRELSLGCTKVNLAASEIFRGVCCGANPELACLSCSFSQPT